MRNKSSRKTIHNTYNHRSPCPAKAFEISSRQKQSKFINKIPSKLHRDKQKSVPKHIGPQYPKSRRNPLVILKPKKDSFRYSKQLSRVLKSRN